MSEVAPLAGAWIEILFTLVSISTSAVAPLAGAWIEIQKNKHPTRFKNVAPLAGAWIEIDNPFGAHSGGVSRSPRGSVD